MHFRRATRAVESFARYPINPILPIRSSLMFRSISKLFVLVLACGISMASAQDRPQAAARKVPNGVYRLLRDGASEKEVAPPKDGEVVLVDRHRYAKADANEPPRYLVVHSAPDVMLYLAREPVGEKNGAEVRITLKLRPQAAESLERVTREHPGGQLTIVLDGDVVTTHKI